MQMNEYKYHYLYTKFNIDAFDLDEFKYNFVNITAFRLVDVEDIGVREIIKDMKRFQQKQQHKHQNQSQQKQISPAKFIGVIIHHFFFFAIFTTDRDNQNLLNVCHCYNNIITVKFAVRLPLNP